MIQSLGIEEDELDNLVVEEETKDYLPTRYIEGKLRDLDLRYKAKGNPRAYMTRTSAKDITLIKGLPSRQPRSIYDRLCQHHAFHVLLP